MKVDHSEYLSILRSAEKAPEGKKVFIRSGIRYDYVMADKSDEFLREVCKYHVSGVLKVAPGTYFSECSAPYEEAVERGIHCFCGKI